MPALSKTTIYACWSYLVVALLLWGAIFFGGDRWWPATVLLFGPRWCAALPLVVLVPLAAWHSRRGLVPLLLGALVVFAPLMGLRLSFGHAAKPPGPVLRIITCNVDNGHFSADALVRLIQETRADIVALQEFPADQKLQLPPGWRIVEQRGLAVLSHLPLRRGVMVPVFDPPDPWPITCLLHCVVSAQGAEIDFCSVQLPTPRFGLLSLLDRTTLLRPSRKGFLLKETAYRQRAAVEVQAAVAAMIRPVVVAGDFNMPVDSTIYRGLWTGYGNAFSRAGRGYGFTQRVMVKGLSVPVRIDHILTSTEVQTYLCQTGPDVGSDHLPLIADISVSNP